MKRTTITPSVATCLAMILFLLLAITQPLQSQTPMTIKHGCNFAAGDTQADSALGDGFNTILPSISDEELVEITLRPTPRAAS